MLVNIPVEAARKAGPGFFVIVRVLARVAQNQLQFAGHEHVAALDHPVLQGGLSILVQSRGDRAILEFGVEAVVFQVGGESPVAVGATDLEARDVSHILAGGYVVIAIVVPGKSGDANGGLLFPLEVALGKFQRAEGMKVDTPTQHPALIEVRVPVDRTVEIKLGIAGVDGCGGKGSSPGHFFAVIVATGMDAQVAVRSAIGAVADEGALHELLVFGGCDEFP